MQTIFVFIEGNIGAGKTTLVNKIKQYYGNKIEVINEPVNIWNKFKNENDVTIMEKYYENKERWSFTFQVLAFVTHLENIINASNSKKNIIFFDRSILTNKYIFAQISKNKGNLSKIEWEIYEYLTNFIEEKI